MNGEMSRLVSVMNGKHKGVGMMDRERLAEAVEQLVWSALFTGQMMGNPMTPDRRRDQLHAEVWQELQEVLRMIDE